MEYGELHDAYNSGICDAQVGESEALAAARLEQPSAPASRILTEPLATFPVFVATPPSDPRWSAIVTWSIYALQRAELPATPWTTAGPKSFAVEGRDLGLAEDCSAAYSSRPFASNGRLCESVLRLSSGLRRHLRVTFYFIT